MSEDVTIDWERVVVPVTLDVSYNISYRGVFVVERRPLIKAPVALHGPATATHITQATE